MLGRTRLERAGWARFPTSWEEWRACMHDLGTVLEPGAHAIFLPLNEWNQPVLLGLLSAPGTPQWVRSFSISS